MILMAHDMSMPKHTDIAVFQIKHWSAGYFRMMLSMLVIMMVGMMLLSAAPMILIYAAVARKSEKEGVFTAKRIKLDEICFY